MRTVITGATGGIGEATAQRLAAEAGAQVALVVRDLSRAAGISDRLRLAGADVHIIMADVADPAAAASAIAAADQAMGGIDALVISSGSIANEGAMCDLTPDRFQAAFDINTRPLFLFGQAAYPSLKASRGAIVAVSSAGGVHPVQGLGAYSASKAALVMLARQMALEWGPDGIRVNCVSPGPTATAMAPAYADPAIRGRRASTLPLRRINEPEDVAAAVAFLLGEGGRGITGVDLMIDNGMSVTTMQLSGGGLGRGAE